MPNSKIQFYVVELYNNIYYTGLFSWGTPQEVIDKKKKETPKDRVVCYMRKYGYVDGFASDDVPIIAIQLPDKSLVEFFTHKVIEEKNSIVINGLSYTSKREPKPEELKKILFYSKMLKEHPDTVDDYKKCIEEIEKNCIEEFEEYNATCEELESTISGLNLKA